MSFYSQPSQLSQNLSQEEPRATQGEGVPGEEDVRYLAKNLLSICRSTLERHGHLLHGEEMAILRTYLDCPRTQQNLFARLYYRKGPWFRMEKLNYQESEVGVLVETAGELHKLGLVRLHLPPAHPSQQKAQNSSTGNSSAPPGSLVVDRDLLDCILANELKEIACRTPAFHRDKPKTKGGYIDAIIASLNVSDRANHFAASPCASLESPSSEGVPDFAFSLTQGSSMEPIDIDAMDEDDEVIEVCGPPSAAPPKPSPPEPAGPGMRRGSLGPGDAPPPKRQRQTSLADFFGGPARSPSAPPPPQPLKSKAQGRKDTPGMGGRGQLTDPQAVREAVERAVTPCLRLPPCCKDLCSVLERLFYLDWESVLDNTAQPSASAKLTLKELQILRFPCYTVSRGSVFATREDFEAYHKAMAHRERFLHLTGKDNPRPGSYGKAPPENIKEILKVVKEDVIPYLGGRQGLQSGAERWQAGRHYLYRFTEEYVYLRSLADGIEVLESTKNYEEACLAILLILDFKGFRPGKRGVWWNRMAIDLEHLGKKEDALLVTEQALKDEGESMRLSDRLSLERRLVKLHVPPRRWGSIALPLALEAVGEAPSNTIEGTRRSKQDRNGSTKSVWVHPVTGEGCSVERYCLGYYEQEGGWKGEHCEGGMLRTLFGLLMWDQIFMEVEEVFQTPFQNAPLDIGTPHFYEARREAIEERIATLAKSTPIRIARFARERYEQEEGVSCLGIGWETFAVDLVSEVIECFDPQQLAGLLQEISQRYALSGFPDLFLWHPEKRLIKIVEVKGPNDKLSEKQVVWLSVLRGLGLDATTLYVTDGPQKPKPKPKRKKK